jgi:hypothetical protein
MRRISLTICALANQPELQICCAVMLSDVNSHPNILTPHNIKPNHFSFVDSYFLIHTNTASPAWVNVPWHINSSVFVSLISTVKVTKAWPVVRASCKRHSYIETLRKPFTHPLSVLWRVSTRYREEKNNFGNLDLSLISVCTLIWAYYLL